MAELVDAADLKSASREGVWVRFPPSALVLPKASENAPQLAAGDSF